MPVPFLVHMVVSGLSVPFARPKMAAAAVCECAPPSRLYLPARFAATFLDVVFSPNVLPVGAMLGGNCDL